jgi:hypothetical protein
MQSFSSARPARCAHAILLALALLLASPLAVAAQAGKVVFAVGSVTLEAGGRPLKAGDPLNVGDTVVTAPGARAQLLLGDGAKLALRAGSRFRIDEFQLGAAIRDPGSAAVTASTGRSISTLLKGGFRTVSGSIGKGEPGAYEVRVPVGTLGIRGTDYVAVFCRGDCTDAPGLKPGEPVRDGLYLGVYTGSIVFRGGGLEVVVAAGEFVFLPVPGLTPEPQQQPPAPTQGDGAGPLNFTGHGAAGLQGHAAIKDVAAGDLNGRRGPPPPAEPALPAAQAPALPIGAEVNGKPVDLTPGQPPRTLGSAYATGPLGSIISPVVQASAESVYAFAGTTGGATRLPVVTDAGAAQLGIGTAVASDAGFDPTSGLRWGRWSGGSVDLVSGAGAVTPLQLGTDSVHWVTGTGYDDSHPPTLPQSGSATYGVVGATSPSEANGTLGKFGGAWLAADFTNRTVDATLSVHVGGLDWYATAVGQPILGTLTVQGTWTGSVANAAPLSFSQFRAIFMPSADTTATLPVIAMSYSLSIGAGPVSGVIALAPNAAAQAPAPPPLGNRDLAIAFSNDLGNGEQGQSAVATNAPGQYALQGAAGIAVDVVKLADGSGTTASIGTATVVESGTDPTTFLRWGRWSGGIAQLQNAAGQTTAADLTQRSLHWIAPGDFGATPPAMPIAGTRVYDVVGGTSPTDALGNVGKLGSLTLTADFARSAVTADISLTIASTTWTAQGAGSIGTLAKLPAEQFSGNFAAPTIGGVAQAAGGGQFNGFFSNLPGQTAGAPGAAGISYFLTAPAAGVVSGAAALVGR